MIRLARSLPSLLLTAGLFLVGFLYVREEVTTRLYQEKLSALAADYASLATHYNEAIRQSAITELEVTPGSLNVLIRTADGQLQRIPTPFDPAREIYVDYLLGNGRIWIRRIFDDRTAPEDALLIDPLWQDVDWPQSGLRYGKAIYRSLQPGLWAIQVSGNGALSLEPVPTSQAERLLPAPEIRSYEEIQLELAAEVDRISTRDLIDFCLSPLRR